MDLSGFDPDLRLVRFPGHTVEKVLRAHPEMDGCIEEALEAIAHPDHREIDPHGTGRRERYYRHRAGRWMRVVVEYVEGDSPAEGAVVTAFWQYEDPS